MKKKLLVGVVATSVVAGGVHLYSSNKELQTELEVASDKVAILSENYNQVVEHKTELEVELGTMKSDYQSLQKELEVYKTPVKYNPYNLLEVSRATSYSMRKALEGTNLYSLADTFVEIEDNLGINAYFLASLCAQESSWGNSNRAKTQNNLTGYAVYHDGSKGASFSNKDDSIWNTAKLLVNEYLSPNGDHYNGLSIWNVNTNYCLESYNGESDYDWSSSINKIANKLINKSNN